MALEPLRVPAGCRRHHAMIGVGGIGTGRFFALAGSETLGREESRAGRLLDRRDYCKLHIVSHYVQALLGREFTTLPIGLVGGDEDGARLLGEMAAAGLDVRYVRAATGRQTLFSFCLLYPDGSGGNLTTEDSACSEVDPGLVASAVAEFERFAGRGVALALPEVPLAARAALLSLGGRHGFFRAASFTAGEVAEAARSGLLAGLDLLALNTGEAAALAGTRPGAAAEEVVEAVTRGPGAAAAARIVSITAGRRGSWVWDGQALHHLPAIPVAVAGAAGAGDAHLSGLIAGLASGLSLEAAHHLAVLVAARSVLSPHTICPELDRRSLRALARSHAVPLPEAVERLLEGPP